MPPLPTLYSIPNSFSSKNMSILVFILVVVPHPAMLSIYSYSKVTPYALGTICYARDQAKVSCMQGRHHKLCNLSPVPNPYF